MNQIEKAFAESRPSVGSWVTIGNGVTAEIMGRAGLDFCALDAQHGGIDWHNLADTLRAVELGGTQTLMRVPWCTPDYIMRALDLGAGGVIVPMVSTQADAVIAARSCRYPPDGERSFGKVRNYYMGDEGSRQPLCFVMIESVEAMGNLDAIAATPGVDGLFLGPVDLALSMGLGAALQMPDKVLEAVDQIVEVAAKHGKISGGAALGAHNAREQVSRGMRLIVTGMETGFIRAGAAETVALARELKMTDDQTEQ